MRTFILAWVIGLLGLVMIGGGIWGVIDLYRQQVGWPAGNVRANASNHSLCADGIGISP